ncbi:hypothetical protein MAM1_0278d09144 [Mucor ambiguus]|uniref:Membrane anchor Opy2 N-terminal domain-containing protein n=1 Tax=Mucor ambiguus TaxID=91626 RepID=A0A0C9N4W0_9FUNG|nr:hypothetical protein MAM1_0278d09144 [Mucor ambiguus]
MHNNHKRLKRTNKLIARNFNLTQQTANLHSCNPPRSCKKECTPACNTDQICVYKIVTECGTCPPTYCADSNQLQVTATDFEANSNANNNHQQTVLIAGLTTGLVVLALIAATVAGFVFHRRRKLQKILLQQQQDEKKAYIPPHPPIIISDINSVLPPPPSTLQSASILLPPISEHSSNSSSSATPISNRWHQQAIDFIDYDHPQSPFIIGAQSLQIPHLDTPDPSSPSNATLIRRSLNIQPTIITDNGDFLSRASSVKITKYDNRPIPIKNRFYDTQSTANDDDDDDEYSNSGDENETVKIRRAVSVKKNNSTASHSSSITRVGSVTSEDVKVVCAKPTMVRINTITSKEGGITRKRSIRTVIDQQQQPPFQVSLHDPSTPPDEDGDAQSDRIDVYFCPPAPPPPILLHNPSQVSIQSSNSSSTAATGYTILKTLPGPSIFADKCCTQSPNPQSSSPERSS